LLLVLGLQELQEDITRKIRARRLSPILTKELSKQKGRNNQLRLAFLIADQPSLPVPSYWNEEKKKKKETNGFSYLVIC